MNDYSKLFLIMSSTHKHMSVSEFKAQALGTFERIAKAGLSIVVTKRGKPIAKVTPYSEQKEAAAPGRLAGTLLYEGDLVSPLGADLWNAARP